MSTVVVGFTAFMQVNTLTISYACKDREQETREPVRSVFIQDSQSDR
jgi:hypothetical protein